MRVLFLSQRVPYPPNRGDKILTWRLVERLGRKNDVTIIAFSHGEDDEAGALELRKKGYSIVTIPYDQRLGMLRAGPRLLRGEALTLGVYGSRRLAQEVERRAGSTELMFGFSSSMGAFMLPYQRHARVMHFCELDSDKWRQYAEREPWPKRWVYRREHQTLLKFERQLAEAMDENIVCTPLEQRIFSGEIPNASVTVVQNGVDLAYFSPSEGTRVPRELVFTGVMNYLPNVDGCLFFVREVLPELRQRWPDLHFTIVGAHPTDEVKALGEVPGVSVTGFVKDVRDYLRKASISVAPLRIARGIQNKALEAMAMGLPVVGTTSATQGIAGTDGQHYLVADGKEALVAAVSKLLEDEEAARALGRRARAYVEEHHDWERSFARIDDIVAEAPRRRDARLRGRLPA
ncbi:MAG: TIGR03087 family PEP-CTERM/XrtA system glycosyltransferase [Myxococcota bacterium]